AVLGGADSTASSAGNGGATVANGSGACAGGWATGRWRDSSDALRAACILCSRVIGAGADESGGELKAAGWPSNVVKPGNPDEGQADAATPVLGQAEVDGSNVVVIVGGAMPM